MKKIILTAAVAALAACSQGEAPEPAASDTAVASEPAADATMAAADYVGTWEATMADGTKGSTVINADMSYVDSDPKTGETKGTFSVKEGKACFAPSDGKPEMCWTLGAVGADGAMPATADDGTKITVKKTA